MTMNQLPLLSKMTLTIASASRSQMLPRLCASASLGNTRYYSENGSQNNGDKAKQPAKGESKRIRPKGWLARILTGPSGIEPRYLQSHSSILSDSDYIYELVTHDAKPGQRDEYLKLYSLYADEVRSVNEEFDLLGSWKVYYANRDQAVHLWRFRHGYAGIDRSMKAVLSNEKVKKLESDMSNRLIERHNVLIKSFSFWGEPEPREESSIYELRTYTLRPGTLIEWGAAWAKGIKHRREGNQNVGGFFTQIGPMHRVFHLWAYPSLDGRNDTRQKTWAKPGWDQTVMLTVPLIKNMESKILVPTEMSKLK